MHQCTHPVLCVHLKPRHALINIGYLRRYPKYENTWTFEKRLHFTQVFIFSCFNLWSLMTEHIPRLPYDSHTMDRWSPVHTCLCWPTGMGVRAGCEGGLCDLRSLALLAVVQSWWMGLFLAGLNLNRLDHRLISEGWGPGLPSQRAFLFFTLCSCVGGWTS